MVDPSVSPAVPRSPGGAAATRDDLAARQAALLTALVAGGPCPPGFDAERLAVEADVLRAKRRRVLARWVPDEVADRLGAALTPLLDAWIAAHPRRTGTSSRADAAAFVAHLRATGVVPRVRWWRRGAGRGRGGAIEGVGR